MMKMTVETSDSLVSAIRDVKGWRQVRRVRGDGKTELFIPPEVSKQAIEDAVDDYPLVVETIPSEQPE